MNPDSTPGVDLDNRGHAPAPAPVRRRIRAKRRSSVLFATLANGTTFWLPARKRSFLKVGFLTADQHGKRSFVNPLRSVFIEPSKPGRPETELERLIRENSERMQREVREVVAQGSPFLNLLDPNQTFPAVNDGITHYAGDSCPGGHQSDGSKQAVVAEMDAAKVRVDSVAVPVQPHSDNNITGPTS